MSDTTPVSSGGFRLCPMCKRQPAKVQLWYAWVCEDCRNAFAWLRLGAFAIDLLLLILLFYVPLRLLTHAVALRPALEVGWPPFCLLMFLFKDGLNGASPGKRLMGLYVVFTRTRARANIVASLKRNLILLIPGVNLVVAVLVLNGTRIGEGWAGTMVIWRRHATHFPFSAESGRYCIECGYDLTGNRSGLCPECGRPIPGARPAPVRSIPDAAAHS